MRSDDIFVDLPPQETYGMPEQFSLEERIRRVEHDAGLLPINARGRQHHCWLCRAAYLEERRP